VKAHLVRFGEIEVEGESYTHDIVIDGGEVRKRQKKPSKKYRAQDGHTPLSGEEPIPWGGEQLVIGTGVDGRLPIMPEVEEEARRRGVKLVAMPTEQACEFLGRLCRKDVHAILHTTC